MAVLALADVVGGVAPALLLLLLGLHASGSAARRGSSIRTRTAAMVFLQVGGSFARRER
jgi:hypothetical protein